MTSSSWASGAKAMRSRRTRTEPASVNERESTLKTSRASGRKLFRQSTRFHEPCHSTRRPHANGGSQCSRQLQLAQCRINQHVIVVDPRAGHSRSHGGRKHRAWSNHDVLVDKMIEQFFDQICAKGLCTDRYALAVAAHLTLRLDAGGLQGVADIGGGERLGQQEHRARPNRLAAHRGRRLRGHEAQRRIVPVGTQLPKHVDAVHLGHVSSPRE